MDETNGTDEAIASYVPRDEASIGIQEYVSNHRGFHGIIKKRYSDFIVNEITEKDEIVKLTTIKLPPMPEKEKEDTEESRSLLIELLTQEQVKELDDAFDSDEVQERVKPEVKIDVTCQDKEWRKKLHKSISVVYPGIFTNTTEVDGKKIMVINRERIFRSITWPFPGDHTHFVVYQENRGTIASVGAISRVIRNNQKAFRYTGTKDKRAVASQRMSCYRLHPNKLIKVNDSLRTHYNPLAVGNITFSSNELSLGQSHGNRFQIVLRDVKAENPQDIEEAFIQLREHGFVNYFGSQRFGNGTVRTDRIGRLILQQDWKGAVEHIMQPKLRDMKSFNGSFNDQLKKWQETKDSKTIFENFFWKDSNEGIILRELSKDPNNYKNAIISIPRNNRNMYVHAYQSWIWNHAVSARIRIHGCKVLEGDLILPKDIPEADEEEIVEDTAKKPLPQPLVAEASALDSFSIFDVVIPVYGTSVRLADNDTGKEIERLLKEDGVTPEHFNTSGLGFTIYGGYRKMLIRPKDLTFEIAKYRDETVRLFQTDLELLSGIQKETEEFDSGDQSAKTAVKLEVSLPSSSYATVFARELMRRSEADILKDLKG
jgi:tRNA pseudouridine13 synthase